jgi:ribosomal protein L37AE/L43A
MQEIIQCPRCKRDINANHDDPGTYYCDKCYKPEKRIEQYIQDELRTLIIKIYNDAKTRRDNYERFKSISLG